MINLIKKLFLSLSLIIALVMGLVVWGPVTPLQVQADQVMTPGTYSYNSFFLDGGKAKINGVATSVSFYASNDYVVGPNNAFFNLELTMPNFRAAIGNWESITVKSTSLRIRAKYEGPEPQAQYQKLYAAYGSSFIELNTFATQTNGLIVERQGLDAHTLPSVINIEMALLDSRGSMQTYTGLSGTLKIYRAELIIEYEYVDGISPIMNGAGSLVASRNLAVPNLVSKPLVSENTYKIYDLYGVVITYSTVTGNYEINGTATQTLGYSIMLYVNDFSIQKTMTFYGVSGERTSGQMTLGNYVSGGVPITINSMTLPLTATSNISKSDLQTSGGPRNIDLIIGSGITFTNYKFKIQIELGSTSNVWTHPSSIYYSTASIQHDQAPDSVSTIMSNVYAYDDVDGNITDRFQVVDTAREYAAVLANRWRLNVNATLAAYDDNSLNVQITNTITLNKAYVDAQFAIYQTSTYWYNLNNNTLVPYNLTESYKFMAYVGDISGNYSFLEISVFVNDATAPVIAEGHSGTVTVSYKSPLDMASWLASIEVTDNVDLTVTPSIYANGYTDFASHPGTYQVFVRATDSTGNMAQRTFTFVVIDDIAPVFNGPESIFKPQSSTMTIAEVKARYTAFDEIAGNVTSRIVILTDGYTGKGHLIGTYYVVFRVTDLVGNITDLSIPITVSDDIPPVIYVADGYFIQVSAAYTLTIEGIRDILVATGRLTIVSATTYQVLVNEYAGNENTPGIYTISIRFSQTSGVTEVHSVAVNVKNASTIPDGTFNPPSDNSGIMYIGLGILAVAVMIYLFRKK